MKFDTVSEINLLQNCVNVFHLTWIMSLHYPVKLNMLAAHTLPLRCQRKYRPNSKIYPTSTVASKFARFDISWLQRVEILREKVYKTRITDLESGPIDDATNEWLPQWRRDPIGPLHRQSLFQFIQISDEYFEHLLLQYSSHSAINWIQILNLEAIVKME